MADSNVARKPGNPNWVKGVSGNPGGRPSIPAEFRAKCREAAREGLPRLLTEVATGGPHWAKAWELLAAYGFGRPTQPIAGEDGGPVQFATSVVILPAKDARLVVDASPLEIGPHTTSTLDVAPGPELAPVAVEDTEDGTP